MRKIIPIGVGVIFLGIGVFLFRRCGRVSHPGVSRVSVSQELLPVQPVPIESSTVSVSIPIVPEPPKKVELIKPKKPIPKPVPTTNLAPPPVEIHKELIPKNIEIVRVYYQNMLVAPGGSTEFDINGSGFTFEFEKMIQVQSGHSDVKVTNLALLTPNQIHGTLIISEKATTAVAFPQVLINKKVVFQAPDPFAVIRPGEVLNVIFTEMGESGRTGRFRVFTNLNESTFKEFKVVASTTVIEIADLTPSYPFIVDGDIRIGPAAGGEYGMKVLLGEKILWNRDGIIRVVRPNVGQTGLVQRIYSLEEFLRPGDNAVFNIQGSGFLPADAGLLSARVKGFEIKQSTFVYLAPGRMELRLNIPQTALPGVYGITIAQADKTLLDVPQLFSVVGPNWTRGFKLEPKLVPGGSASLILVGRDMSPEFIASLKIEVDEPDLKIGSFSRIGSSEASAPISAGLAVKPGDYLLHVTSKGEVVSPAMGSIIRILK